MLFGKIVESIEDGEYCAFKEVSGSNGFATVYDCIRDSGGSEDCGEDCCLPSAGKTVDDKVLRGREYGL